MTLCACGCGQETPLAKWTDRRCGHFKGRPVRFVNGHNARRPAADRFWSKVEKTDGCWLWTAAKNEHGYGVFRLSAPRRMAAAYRVSYEMAHGPIPDDRELDHLCRTPSCVRPDHLEVVTHKENMRRWMLADGVIVDG